MANVACFCGSLYSFDGDEGPCPRCGAVAVVRTHAIRKTSQNRGQNKPDAATTDVSQPTCTPVPSGQPETKTPLAAGGRRD
jgi:hypothetical protein